MWVALSQSFKQSLNQASPQARMVSGVSRHSALDTVPTAASLFDWAPDWACAAKGQAITKSGSAKRPIRIKLLQVLPGVPPSAQASPGNGATISGEILKLSGHAPPGAGADVRAPGAPSERAMRGGQPSLRGADASHGILGGAETHGDADGRDPVLG